MASDSRSRSPHGNADANLAYIIGTEVNALRLEAISVLDQKQPEEYASEHRIIKDASLGAYGSPQHALSNVIAHLTNHRAALILDTYMEATDAGLPKETLLTDDHIIVRTALSNHHSELVFNMNRTFDSSVKYSYADHKSIMFHALNNIGEGYFIVSMYVERDMYNLQEILDFLPTLKASHAALTEGTL